MFNFLALRKELPIVTLSSVATVRSVQSPSPQPLVQRLETERARRFVGRDAELELFAARLAAARTRATADLFNMRGRRSPTGSGTETSIALPN
jgi:hypothetical protein